MTVDRRDVQGLLLSGYPKLPCARYLLLVFGDAAAARGWVGMMADVVRAGGDPPPQQTASVQLAFTFAGLEHLELSWQALKGFSREFREGMAGSERRRRRLGDVGPNAPENWQWGAAGYTLHGMLLLFAPSEDELQRLTDEQRSLLQQAGIDCIHTLDTQALPNQREHFGFRDGISQPRIAGLSRSTAPHEVVKAGEFLLGEENERGEYTGRPLVDPIEDPTALLPAVPEDSDLRDLGRSGSYLVFRQLSQDVTGLWAWTREAVGAEDAAARIRLVSKMVGRWPGGAPLAVAPDDPGVESSENEFLYHVDDPHGLGCPIGAHVRRSNPRDSLPPKPGSDDSLAINRRHRILRRGRAYGPPLAADLSPEALMAAADDGQERGLHFICVNADISRQFEFVQHTWVENPNFAGLTGEIDPIIGTRSADAASLTVPQDPVRRRYHDLPRFVTVRGGAYLFVPGVRALRYLGAEPRRLATRYSAPDAEPTLPADTWYTRLGRTTSSFLEWLIVVSRRPTRLRNGLDRVLQEPLTNLAQGLLRWRRRRYRIDADLAIAEEREVPGEADVTQRITEQMTSFLFRHYRHGTAERAGNTKTYGLLEAVFEVHDLPQDLRCGLFERPATYRAWVRFGGPGPLATPDIRNNGVLSVGLKVLGVDGETLLEDEQGTQDFSGISAPTFTTPDVVENLKLQQYLGAGMSVWYFLNPFDSHYLDALMQGLYAKAHGSPFETSYYSCVPYLYGAGRAFKYRLAPRVMRRTAVPLPAPDDYLRAALRDNLARHGTIEFDFNVQFQECPMLMPIEDASVIWRSPEVTVATLSIPEQTFDTPQRDRMARELTINPWHALPAHRPLGNQNRARRLVYYETSRVRQRINGESHGVPRV